MWDGVVKKYKKTRGNVGNLKKQWVKENGDLEFDPADMEKFLMAKKSER